MRVVVSVQYFGGHGTELFGQLALRLETEGEGAKIRFAAQDDMDLAIFPGRIHTIVVSARPGPPLTILAFPGHRLR